MFAALQSRGSSCSVCRPEEAGLNKLPTRAENAEISLDTEVISILLLRSTCSCKNRNCFANYRNSAIDPVPAIVATRKQRLQQGFTRGDEGEGPWLARQLMDKRKYVGGTKPYRVCFVFNNVSVCRFAWECLHGLPPGSSRISNFIAMIHKGKDPTLKRDDARLGDKATDRNLLLQTWARKHILMTSECSPIGSEPRMHVPKMTVKDRHLLYVKQTEQQRSSAFGPTQPHLSESQFNKVWKQVMSAPFLHPRTQQYYELSYRTHLSRGFNECDTCTSLRADIAEGSPTTHAQAVQSLADVSSLMPHISLFTHVTLTNILFACIQSLADVGSLMPHISLLFTHVILTNILFVCIHAAQKGFHRCEGNVCMHQSRGFQRCRC